MQTMLPWSTSLDVAYTGRHNYNAQVGGQDFPININTIDLGTAFDPALQDPTLAPSAIPGASSLAAQNPNQVRGYRGYGNITYRQYDGWRTFHSIGARAQPPVQERPAVRVQRHASSCPTSSASTRGTTTGRTARWCSAPIRPQAQELLGNQQTPRHNIQATFVWQLPQTPVDRQPGAQGRSA